MLGITLYSMACIIKMQRANMGPVSFAKNVSHVLCYADKIDMGHNSLMEDKNRHIYAVLYGLYYKDATCKYGACIFCQKCLVCVLLCRRKWHGSHSLIEDRNWHIYAVLYGLCYKDATCKYGACIFCNITHTRRCLQKIQTQTLAHSSM